jgi:hypothetical protein
MVSIVKINANEIEVFFLSEPLCLIRLDQAWSTSVRLVRLGQADQA